MAFLEVNNVSIKGFSACVPKTRILNNSHTVSEQTYDAEAFVELTGVKERRISDEYTTSDLCFYAAEKLMQDLGWGKNEVDAIIFVSQYPDYILPASSCILQNRLGLPKDCYALDISLGCSGWVYGLSQLSSLMSSGHIKKSLLLTGDAKRNIPENRDPLFGHAGTATALQYDIQAASLKFNFGTDGSNYDAIIIPDGGARNQVTSESFKLENFEGKLMNRLQTRMKGMDVFSFGISTAPKSIKKLANNFGFDYLTADYFVFHQANMKMNKMIVKKLGLDIAKVPSCMYEFGNTSSASIPLTIVTQLKGKIEHQLTKFICCGFGVGLSWGTVAFETSDILISDLIEV